MKHIKNISILAILAIAFTACFQYDEPLPPEPATVDSRFIITIDSLKRMSGNLQAGESFRIPDNVFIAGRVISSDRDGNIFREMFIQDHTGGLRIRVGRSNLYNFYRLGQRIYIKCQGLTIGNNRGTMELGVHSANFVTGFIEIPWLINRHILQGIQQAQVEPRTFTLPQLSDADFRRNFVGTLVRIENLTFSAANQIPTWANPNPGDGASPQSLSQVFHQIETRLVADTATGVISQIADTLGQIIVRSSGHARFAGDLVPRNPVDIVGVLTVFDGNNQMFIRDLNDVTAH